MLSPFQPNVPANNPDNFSKYRISIHYIAMPICCQTRRAVSYGIMGQSGLDAAAEGRTAGSFELNAAAALIEQGGKVRRAGFEQKRTLLLFHAKYL